MGEVKLMEKMNSKRKERLDGLEERENITQKKYCKKRGRCGERRQRRQDSGGRKSKRKKERRWKESRKEKNARLDNRGRRWWRSMLIKKEDKG